jgi:origin recognition complex subunit 1
VYISLSSDVNPLDSIDGKAVVVSQSLFLRKFPTGKIPKQSPYAGKTFVCRRGLDMRTTTYSDEFVWEDIYSGHSDLAKLLELVREQTRAKRRQRGPRTGDVGDDDADFYLDAVQDGNDGAPFTPRGAKRTRSPVSAHKRQVVHSREGAPERANAGLVAGANAVIRSTQKRRLEFTPLGTRKLGQGDDGLSPFRLARNQLHVASVPRSLPCRESEFEEVYFHLEKAITNGTSNCIYISGTPGTGKTATVREVISCLEGAVAADELDDFIFVEINGMKITDPHHSYVLLWEALKGVRVSPAQALDLLEREFGYPNPRRVPCVVLMDELDQLVTKNQGVMYNFFNWPALRHSRLIVLAVANTMDLPERTLSNKISSRLGLTRISFPGYNHEQLMRIIQSRLEGVPGDLVESDAIQFASRKVAAVSGDARRALDICRRAVELVEADYEAGAVTPSRRQGPAQGHARAKVTIATIKRAINEATSSPIQQSLRTLSFLPKLLLAALLARLRRSGLGECQYADVVDEMALILKVSGGRLDLDLIPSLHLMALPPDAADLTSTGGKQGRLAFVGEAAMELEGAGLLVLEDHRPHRPSKIRLAVADDEVKMAFRDDPEMQAIGVVF